MDTSETALIAQALGAWRVHNRINLDLLEAVTLGGLRAVPPASRGRTVAEQFAHLTRVRAVWLAYHATGKRVRPPRVEKGAPIPRTRLRAELRKTGLAIERLLADSLAGRAKIRLFKRQPLRFLGYLIAHESHHRGQILLALKQNGLRLPDKVAVQGVWGPWLSGE